MPRYEIWLTDDVGLRLAYLDDVLGGYFYRITNAPGPFRLRLSPSFDTPLLLSSAQLIPDRMIQFWRAPTDGNLALWRTYFVQYLAIGRNRAGKLEIEIRGYDAVELLKRRITAAYSGEATATFSGIEGDDAMKDILAAMVSDAAAPVPSEGTRAWGDLSIQADATAGPQLDKSFAWREVLVTLQDLAMEARQAGTEVFFDIVHDSVSSTAISFEFKTSTGQPVDGTDLTSLGGVFDEAQGNLQVPKIVYDNREAVNYVYGGGQGEGLGREVQQVADSTRYGLSQWNRRERFAQATLQTSAAAVADVARQKLTEGEPVVAFRARPQDTAAFRFGTDWNYGDKVTAVFLGQEYTTIIRKVGIKLDAGQGEEIDAIMEYQE
jgi:hypothetical protein